MKLQLPKSLLAASLTTPFSGAISPQENFAYISANAVELSLGSEASDTGPFETLTQLEQRSNTETFIVTTDEVWNEETEDEFHELAIAESLDQLDDSQTNRIEHLTALRRAHNRKIRRNAEDILRELQQSKLMSRMMSLFFDYVKVIGKAEGPAEDRS